VFRHVPWVASSLGALDELLFLAFSLQRAWARGRPGLSAAVRLGAAVGRFSCSRRTWSRLDKALLPVWVQCLEAQRKVHFRRISCNRHCEFGEIQRHDGRVVTLDPNGKKEGAILVFEPLGFGSGGWPSSARAQPAKIGPFRIITLRSLCWRE
jgi:hypothetical protein